MTTPPTLKLVSGQCIVVIDNNHAVLNCAKSKAEKMVSQSVDAVTSLNLNAARAGQVRDSVGTPQ